MANYLSLEEAAKKLGVPAERLVELRSQGQVRGFRDGASWKFPENEIERLSDELGDAAAGGSGVLVNDGGLSSGGSNIIGGDAAEDGGGSDLGIGSESLQPGSGSDVNLVPSEGEGSDVAVVAGDSDLFEGGSDLLEIDSAELQLNDPAIMHDSAQLDLAIEPNAGSTGPVTDQELKEIAESHPDVLAPERDASGSGSELDLGNEDDLKLSTGSDLSFSDGSPDDDSGEELIGADEDSGMDVLGSDIEPGGSQLSSSGASSLELMGDLDEPSDLDVASMGSRSADVLSELDLLGTEQSGSGLISGDSENLLGSDAGSGLGSGLDDALADDDELVIADDDDDLVISGAGSDISVAGDSGINLMSPSDSGLSLESEPLDLAGSSISALDLGAELSEGGSSGSGVGSSGGSGSMVDFQADEEFQLSPSGVGLDADFESGSQVIEVEDSEAIGEPVEFAEAGIVEAEPLGGDVFGAEPQAEEALALDDESEGIAIDESSAAAVGPTTMGGYEVPFTIMQCVTLMLILCVLSLGGMLMTDLVRNMWTYTEPAAPVSSLTDSLVSMMGWGK
ncbi:MAG: helix-turn-helix domain-containing protein [Rubripirellula sp.]